MKKNIRQRIEALEARYQREPVILHFADGSQRTIRGNIKHWFALNRAAFERMNAEDEGLPVPENPLSDEVEALKSSIRIDEPAGMFNLLWAILSGPIARGEVNTKGCNEKTIKQTKSLRQIGVEILAQSSIVVALTRHLISAVDSRDEELHDLLDGEIDRAQVRIRKLAALVPISRKHLAKNLLGFRNGVKTTGRPIRRESSGENPLRRSHTRKRTTTEPK